MNLIDEKDSIGITAAELIVAAFKINRFGYVRGYPMCNYSAEAMQSDYAGMVARDLGIKVHFDRENAHKMTSHPVWVWLEKI